MAKSFPDLNKDGEVTRADVLKGRGVEMKKGGKVNWIQDAIKKPTYKSGGKVSASSRADGCAMRGKTKGRIV